MLELVSKKEFYTRYASPSLKRELKGSAVGLYVCAGITVVFHMLVSYWSSGPMGFVSNGIPWVDLVLMVGCALGLQFWKSRACAVVVMTYSVINTLILLLDTGKIGGWWIIVFGITALRATFSLHKEYVRYLRSGELPEESRPPASEPSFAVDGLQQPPVIVVRETTPVYKPTALLATAAPFLLLFPCLLLMLLVLSDTMLKWLVGSEADALALLTGYQKQYILCLGLPVMAVAMAVSGIVISLRLGIKNRNAYKLVAVCTVFLLLFPTVLILMEDFPALIAQTREDIEQIHEGSTEEAVVWISPRAGAAYLPGPSGAKPVMRYLGIGEDTGGIWEYFYVPNSMGYFMNNEALYNENRSIQWNEENASRYRMKYTTNFRLVVSVEEIPKGKHYK